VVDVELASVTEVVFELAVELVVEVMMNCEDVYEVEVVLVFLPEVIEYEEVVDELVKGLDEEVVDELVKRLDEEVVDEKVLDEARDWVDVELVLKETVVELCDVVVTVLDVVEVTIKIRSEVEVEEVVELVDALELLDVVGSTELSERVVCVVVNELDAVVDDNDVVFEKARGAKDPTKLLAFMFIEFGMFTY
jgi:hypothetical protein